MAHNKQAATSPKRVNPATHMAFANVTGKTLGWANRAIRGENNVLDPSKGFGYTPGRVLIKKLGWLGWLGNARDRGFFRRLARKGKEMKGSLCILPLWLFAAVSTVPAKVELIVGKQVKIDPINTYPLQQPFARGRVCARRRRSSFSDLEHDAGIQSHEKGLKHTW